MSNPNYAPNPKKQTVYTNLQNKTLSNVTADDIQKLTDPTFIQSTNQDALITYNTINQAAMRDGNIMPDKGGIITQTQTDGTVAIEFRPPKGEVWKIMGMSIYNTETPTGTNSYYWYLSTPELAIADLPSGLREVFYSSFSSSSTLLGAETIFEEVFQPFFITNSMYIRMYSNMANVGAGGNVDFRCAYMNIR